LISFKLGVKFEIFGGCFVYSVWAESWLVMVIILMMMMMEMIDDDGDD